MNRTLPFRIFHTILLAVILVIYSSEVSFMPNYIDRPDKWHLLLPMVLIYPTLILSIGYLAFKKYGKSDRIELFGLSLISLIGFTILNNPKGNAQDVGYCVSVATFIFSGIRIIWARGQLS